MATYYLNADSGDNGNDGSSGSPWETVAYARTQATDGDTLILQTATAHYISGTVTFAEGLTIQGETTDPANHIVDFNAGNYSWELGAYTYTIKYLTFTNFNEGKSGYYPILSLTNSGTYTIENCVFRDGGVEAGTNSNYGGGVIGKGSAITNATVTVRNCLFYKIDSAHDTNYGVLITVMGASNSFTLTGCTFYFGTTETYYPAKVMALTATPNDSKNNIFYNGSGEAIEVAYSPASDGTYSCHYNMTSPPAGTGNITSDPLFVDPDNDNFHLRATSPCIDAGTLI